MNSLKITLMAPRELRLPMAYNNLIQGALYACWREKYPALHDEGYTDGGHSFRMFTFGPLQGRYQVEGRQIRFQGPVRFEVRSPVSALMEELAEQLLRRGCVRLGDQELPLQSLETADRLLFFPRAKVRMASLLTLHETLPDGHTVYYAPDDEEFPTLLAGNLASKLSASGVDAAPVLGCLPVPGTLRKRVTTFKGTYITGCTGTLLLETDPEVMALLYYAGLGDRNSQGFGMFTILDQ